MPNLSPWTIGEIWHDQRDLYTRGASIDADGYGRGPNVHPERGSYDYPRPPRRPMSHSAHASIYEREAWPWLNYKDPEDDPYFSFLHRRPKTLWARIAGLFSRSRGVETRPDRSIEVDVRKALADHPDLDATDIDVLVAQGVVTLEGTVADHRSRRLAAHLGLEVTGARSLRNHLTVRHDDPTDANVAFVRSLALMGALAGR